MPISLISTPFDHFQLRLTLAVNPNLILEPCLNRKMRGTAEACHRQGVAFMPLVVESYGGWHEMGVREVERLGAALARQSGQEEDEAVRHLWGKLGILLQRGNAAILANRVPSFPVPAIDGQH